MATDRPGNKAPGALPVKLVSAIIVTHNPRANLIGVTLDSLARQNLPPAEFEVIIVDNASTPPLDGATLRSGRRLNDLTLLCEPRVGVIFARCAAIRAARGGLLVFIDDDNRVATDYLSEALRIASRKPEIGAFGGISTPVLEGAVAVWKLPLLPYLGVRDHGADPISSRSGDWGKWDPIGAGMVVRRDVAEKFVRIVETNPEAGRLGRAGAALMSGEDTLMARLAWLLGYACSYEPTLKLEHYMKAERFSVRVLARTLLGHGRSYVVLQRLLGRPAGEIDWRLLVAFVSSYLHRVRTDGVRAGTIVWHWDLGRILELVERRGGAGQIEIS